MPFLFGRGVYKDRDTQQELRFSSPNRAWLLGTGS